MQEQTIIEHGDAVLWTKDDLIRRTRFSLRSVDYWIEKGQLPYVKIQRGVRFIPSDVEKFIQSHRIGGK
jgi:Helix-turn-helix domain